jgi:EmrB/QacA subfamily drug resistance transporter
METAARAHHNATFAVLTAGVTTFALLQSLVVPVLPTLQADLHTSQAAVTWVLTAYLVSASVCTPILGRVGDMVGKKRMFVVALAGLGVGSVLAAVATNIGVMIVARSIQGLGGGAMPLAFGIIRDEFPREKVAGAVATLASILSVGAGAGIVLAGPLNDSLGVHSLFWVPAILIGLAAVASIVVVPESPVRTPGRISLLPAVLLSVWLVCGLIALSEAPDWGWASARVVGLFAVAVVTAVLWVYSETRAAAPLIDMRMMRLPAVWTTNLAALLVGVGMYAIFAFLPEFVQTPTSAGYGFGASITQSGLILLPSSATMFVIGLYTGRLTRALGGRTLVLIGTSVTTVSMVLLAVAHDHKWELYLITGIMGMGMGLAYSSMASLIVDAVPASQTGVASGMNANIRTIGGSIGAALMASIVTAGAPHGGLPRESGYVHGFWMLVGASAVSVVAALLIPRLRHREPTSDELPHAELAVVAGGTVLGDESE